MMTVGPVGSGAGAPAGLGANARRVGEWGVWELACGRRGGRWGGGGRGGLGWE